MVIDGLVAALVAAGLAGSLAALVLLLVRGVAPGELRPPARLEKLGSALRSPALTGRMAGAVGIGLLTLLLTRWPVAALGAAALVAGWPWMFGGARVEQAQIVRLEALVIWTESLRDTITARASLENAIPATATSAPAAIRPALGRMTGLIRARVPLDMALLSLAKELDDASADKVIGSLVLNVRQRGTGLATVLTSLAKAAREELDQRRRIKAGRAAMRREVQIVVAVTIGFGVFLTVFGRDYVKPYDAAAGQVALAVVVGFFAVGFAWMRKLAGGERAEPFLTRGAIDDADELRIVAHLTGLDVGEAEALASNRGGDAIRRPARVGGR